jgi:hypothetical protein
MSDVIMGDNFRMTAPSTDDPASRYDSAEAAYLDRVREGRASELSASATAVAEAAKAWQNAAYARYFETKAELGESSGAAVQDEISAEKAELLAELWSDIADAHRAADRRS